MSNGQQEQEKRQSLQKRIALKEDGYYSNCSIVETTPFDLAILFGKVRPMTDQAGQSALVEVYERQVYLSHLQAKALHDALGRSLASVGQPGQQRAQVSAQPQAVEGSKQPKS